MSDETRLPRDLADRLQAAGAPAVAAAWRLLGAELPDLLGVLRTLREAENEVAAPAGGSAQDRRSSARRDAADLVRTVRRELGTAVSAIEETLPEPTARLRLALAGLPTLTGEPAGDDEAEAVRLAWPPVVAAYADLAEAATRWLVHHMRMEGTTFQLS